MTSFKTTIVLLLIALAADTTMAQEMVSAVTVKSYPVSWQSLNEYWSYYGDIEIYIDHSTLDDIENLTLADLENVGADVVIVGNTTGANIQWQQSEVDALEAYINQGHTLIGTFVLNQAEVNEHDNRALAPLWGHRSDLEYGTIEADETMTLLDPAHCLFTDIDDPMEFGGYMFDMVPEDDSWDAEDLAGAYFAGRSESGRNVVTVYEAGNYTAFYISNMPEYVYNPPPQRNNDNWQWLYNAIVCEHGPVAAIDIGALPAAQLIGIFPNPFNPQTMITFSLERDEWAEIAVYDLTGKQISVLASSTYAAGEHSAVWNGRDAVGHAVPSGTYVVRLETESSVEARKVMLLR